MDKNAENQDQADKDQVVGDNIITSQQVNISGESSGSIRIEGDFVSGDKISVGNIYGGSVAIGKEASVFYRQVLQSNDIPQPEERLFGMTDLRVDLAATVSDTLGKAQLKIAITGEAGSGKTAVAVELAHSIFGSENQDMAVLWASFGPLQRRETILRRWVRDIDSAYSTPEKRSFAENHQSLLDSIGSLPRIIFFDNVQALADVQDLQFWSENTIYVMTTRNDELAAKWADILYKTSPLSTENSLKVIQLHYALDEEISSEGSLLQEIAGRVGGHPLTLRVIGQFLAGQTLRTNHLGADIFLEDGADDGLLTLERVLSTILDHASEFSRGLIALGAFAPDPAEFGLQALSQVCGFSSRVLLRREIFGLVRIEEGTFILDKALSPILRNQMPEITLEAQERHAMFYLKQGSGASNDYLQFEQIYSQVQWAWQQTGELNMLRDYLEVFKVPQQDFGLMDDHIAWLERFVQLAEDIGDFERLTSGLIQLGDAYGATLKFEDAIKTYLKVIDHFSEFVDEEPQSLILYKIADAYRRLDIPKSSLAYFKEALKLMQDREINPALQAATAVDVGLIYDQLGQTENSLQLFQEALQILETIGDKKAIATTLHNIAAALDNQGRSEEALKYYAQALEVRRELNDMAGIANTLNNIGVLYRGRGEFDLAIRNYLEALSIRETLGDRGGVAVVLHNMGLAYEESGAYERALSQFEQAERIMRAVGDRAGLASTLDKKGRTCLQLGMKDEARQSYEEALATKEEIGDILGQATTHRYLGDALVQLGSLAEAKTHYDKAIDLSTTAGAEKHTGRVFEQLAILYDLEGQSAMATATYEKALALMLSAGYFEGQSRLHITLGQRYAGQKQFDAAQAHFEKAQRIASDIKDWPTVVKVLENSASSYLQVGDVDSALATYKQIVKIVTNKKMDRQISAEIYLNMGTIAKVHERFPEAISFLQQSRDIYLSLNNPAAKSVESLLDELQAAHSDLFDFPSLVMGFFKAAGFEIEEGDNWLVLKPVHRSWQRFDLSDRIPCWLSLGEPLNANRIGQIKEKSIEVEEACNHIFVVIDKTPTDDGWLAIATLRAQGIWLMPITHTIIFEGQAARRQRRELYEQIDQILGRRNLYEVRTPISDPLRFFGRESFASYIIEQLDEGSPVILFGLRKMGKSSLLYYLRDKLPFPTAYVDAQASTDAQSIFERALDKWQDSLRVKAPTLQWNPPELDRDNLQASYTDAVHELFNLLEEDGAHEQICLLVDELEMIHPANRQSTIDNYMMIARTLRGLVQEYGRQFCLVGAAVDPYFNRSSRTDGLQNPLYQFFQEQYVQPLEKADCVQMIRNIGRQMGIVYDEGAAEMIAEVSGGHPLIARQLAGLIYEQNEGDRVSKEMVIEGADLFLRDMQRVDLVGKNGLWAEVSDPMVWTEEQAQLNVKMLSSLAEMQPQPYDQLKGQTPVETADYSIYELSQRAVLNKEEQREYYIRLQLFRKWIRRNILQLQD